MFNLEIRVGGPVNFLAVVGVVVAAIIWVHVWAPRRKAGLMSAPFVIVMAACAALWTAVGYGGLDESEHLHCAYLVSRGLLPYRDFWQHHSPLVWLFLAPFVRWLEYSPWIYEMARLVWTCVFVLIGLLGWAIARRTWRRQANGAVYLLVFLGGAVLWQFPVGRPDLPAVLFILTGIYLCLLVAEGRLWPCLCCGAAISFAMTCTYKQLPLVLVPPIVILSSRTGGRAFRLALYGAGLVLGVLPLAWYLAHNGLLRDYADWVLRFNRKAAFVSASFPLAVAAAGALGWWRLWEGGFRTRSVAFGGLSRRSLGEPRTLVLLLAWPLCTFSSLFNAGATMYYYLNLWLVLAAVIGSGVPATDWLARWRSPSPDKPGLGASFTGGRWAFSAVAGLALALLTLPSLYNSRQAVLGPWRLSHSEFARLIALCRNDTCLVLMPQHPIFCLDATRLYSTWQYEFSRASGRVRGDLCRGGLAAAILRQKPAVITHDVSTLIGIGRGDELFSDMLKRGIITQADHDELRRLLQAEYTVEEIGDWRFYVRNDRAGARSGDHHDDLTGKTPTSFARAAALLYRS